MTLSLRILLIIASLVTMWWILHKIRKLKVKMEDAIFWVVFSGVLLILALFPQISFWLSDLIGIASPANLVFLLIMCLALEKIFTLSICVSALEERVSVLSAEVALRSQAQEKQIEHIENEQEENTREGVAQDAV